MTVFAFGLNHETAPLEVADVFALDAKAQEQVFEAARLAPSAEFMLLSTCNRTEVYLYGTVQDAARLRRLLSEQGGRAWPKTNAFLLQDEAAVRHVLQVAAGMRSLVPGDAQILAQVKDAYRRAVDAEAVGMVLHRLMHTAFRAAKRVATETDLQSGAASVSTAAVALARDYFRERTTRGLEGRRVLLVGAGQMGRLALGALRSHRPASVTVTNRSPERARRVAEAAGGAVVAWARRYEALREAELVIVATGAGEPVLRAKAMPVRSAETPALLIDIARPRNVDPAVDKLPGYTLCDLTALQAWTGRVEAQRRAEMPTAEEICEELLSDFVAWVFHQEALQPAIHAIRDTFEAIRRQEVERHEHRFSEMDRAELDQITRSILQKVLAVPIVRLKSVDPDSIDFVRGIRLLSTLFSRPGCEEEGAGASSQKNAPTRHPELAEELLREALRCPSREDEKKSPHASAD